MRSWELRVATVLVWLSVLPGAACLYLAYQVFTQPDDLLLFVLPLVGTLLVGAGVTLVSSSVALALRLQRRHRTARLQTALLGGTLVLVGAMTAMVSSGAGALMVLYGGLLLSLMTTPGVAAELGPWRQAVEQPAPWGSTPGRGLWSAEPAQQGPWAPPPTTLPWMSWKGWSGPRVPWWQTWRAGLAQGIPLTDFLVLLASALAFLAGNVLTLLMWHASAFHGAGWLGPLLVVASIGAAGWLEQRLRRRLEGR